MTVALSDRVDFVLVLAHRFLRKMWQGDAPTKMSLASSEENTEP